VTTHEPDDPLRQPITERQAEARRQNGRKSRGPKSPEGKAASRANATRHGAYSKVPGAITRGPLAEDPSEVQRRIAAVVESFDLRGDFIATAHAEDLGWALYKARRLIRYEAEALTGTDTGSTSSNEALHRKHASDHRRAANSLRRLSEGVVLSRDETLNGLSTIGFAPEVREEGWADLPEDAPVETFREALIAMIECHFDCPEDAAQLAESRCREALERADAESDEVRPDFVRELLRGDVLARLDRAGAHASVEIDRKLRRLNERLTELGAAEAAEAAHHEHEMEGLDFRFLPLIETRNEPTPPPEAKDS
jgi:hypothetical protein